MIARVHTGKPIDIAHAAKLVDISETQLRRLNPGFKKSTNPNGPFHLVVPIQHAENFKQQINKQGPAKIPSTITTAKAASTVSSTKKSKQADTHQIKTSKAASTDVAVVSSGKTKSATKTSGKIHTVKRGESLPSISKKYKINIKTLLKNNQLKSASSIIQPGQKLIIS